MNAIGKNKRKVITAAMTVSALFLMAQAAYSHCCPGPCCNPKPYKPAKLNSGLDSEPQSIKGFSEDADFLSPYTTPRQQQQIVERMYLKYRVKVTDKNSAKHNKTTSTHEKEY